MTLENDPTGFLPFKVVRRFFFSTVGVGARVPRAAVGSADFKKITGKLAVAGLLVVLLIHAHHARSWSAAAGATPCRCYVYVDNLSCTRTPWSVKWLHVSPGRLPAVAGWSCTADVQATANLALTWLHPPVARAARRGAHPCPRLELELAGG